MRIANAHRPVIEVGGDERRSVGSERDDVSDTGPPPDTGASCEHARDGERVVQRLLGLREDAAVVPPGCLGGLDPEQDAPLRVDVQVGFRGRCQLASRGDTRVVFGSPAQDEREHGEQRRRGGQHGEAREDSTPPTCAPARRIVGRRTSVGEELPFAGGEGEVGRSRPCFELRQTALARKVLGIAPCVLPLLDRLGQPPVQKKVFAPLLDPRAEPVPLREDGLVGDLDRRRPRQWLAVE